MQNTEDWLITVVYVQVVNYDKNNFITNTVITNCTSNESETIEE